MASSFAVAIAAVLQIVLRLSIFIEQNSDMCSTAPTLASWIFLIAFLDVLLDICIYPVRYMHLPRICQVIVETIVAVFLTEIGTLVVWCTIEKNACKLSKALLLTIGMPADFYNSWERYILGIATTSTSVLILFFVAQATDHIYFMRKISLRMCRKINSKLLQIWNKLSSLMVSNKWSNLQNLTTCHNLPVLTNDPEIFYHTGLRNNKRNRSRSRGTRNRSRNHRP